MLEAAQTVKLLIFDGHGAHIAVRRLLSGTPTPEDEALVEACGCKFFSKIRYHEVPEHSLPRLPLKLAFVDGEGYHACHAPCVLVFHGKG